jgi:tetratricopeptide (TPR) repeat protein
VLHSLCYNNFTMSPRFGRIGIVTIAAILCAVAGARRTRSAQSEVISRPASHPPSHLGTILLFPFENESRMASLDWLGEGLAELTSERLQDRGLIVLSRQERLAALEKMGLPDSGRFSHATMVKIAIDADADEVIYGHFVSDGKMVTVQAHVLYISPPRLSLPFTQTSAMQYLLRAHARLSWQMLCAIDRHNCLPEGANQDESSFLEPPASLRLDALENFVKGLTGTEDESRVRSFREAARLEPAWDRPAYELGMIYYTRHDCESALPWFSRVPPNRPDGVETGFDTGVCHLQRNDAARAEAAFAGLVERTKSTDPANRLPELAEVHNNLGIARLRMGKSSEAASEFERAAALDDAEADYWVNLGIAKITGKLPAAAVTPLERARKLAPDDKDARALLISTLESLGRASDAAALRTEAPQSGPRIAQTVPQDPAALARLARVSKSFDHSLLRSTGEVPATPHGKISHGSQGTGEHR